MNTKTTTPNRQLPEGMIKLLRLALESGLDGIELGFEGLGADFPAPIGWQLHLRRVDEMLVEGPIGSDASRANWLNVSAQLGSEITAYVGPVDSENPYLNEEQIAAWITAPRAGITAPTDEERAVYGAETERFVTAVNNGFSAGRELRRWDQVSLTKFLTERATAEKPFVQPELTTVYKFSALNWFYNTVGHPAHRSNGTKVSENLTVMLKDASSAVPFYCAQDGTDISAQEILEKIATKSPWFAQMAYCTEETEDEDGGWVL